VVDPFPISRLVSIAGVAVVLAITRARQHFLLLEAEEEERQQQQQQSINSTSDKSD